MPLSRRKESPRAGFQLSSTCTPAQTNNLSRVCACSKGRLLSNAKAALETTGSSPGVKIGHSYKVSPDDRLAMRKASTAEEKASKVKFGTRRNP